MYVMYAAIDHTRTLQASDTPSTGSTRSPTGAPVNLFVLQLPTDVKTRPWPGCDGEPSSRTAQAQSERTQAIAIMP